MEWISVKDRLPDNDIEVLVYNYKDGINIGEFNKDEVHNYIEDDGSLACMNSGWTTYYDWAPSMCPTHWMPLPKPPEEE